MPNNLITMRYCVTSLFSTDIFITTLYFEIAFYGVFYLLLMILSINFIDFCKIHRIKVPTMV